MDKVSQSLRSSHGQDGAIVLDVQQGQMFNLNLVGSRILQLLEQGSSVAAVVDVISREFNADVEMVGTDVKEFLETLKTYKLLEPSGGTKRS